MMIGTSALAATSDAGETVMKHAGIRGGVVVDGVVVGVVGGLLTTVGVGTGLLGASAFTTLKDWVTVPVAFFAEMVIG